MAIPGYRGWIADSKRAIHGKIIPGYSSVSYVTEGSQRLERGHRDGGRAKEGAEAKEQKRVIETEKGREQSWGKEPGLPTPSREPRKAAFRLLTSEP